MDEPTTGLHLEDIRKLAQVLDRLVDAGHTVLLIEHNLDVIKLADWVIDMGPDGGDGGGELVAMGTPEEIMKVKASHTGQWLARTRAIEPLPKGTATHVEDSRSVGNPDCGDRDGSDRRRGGADRSV
jgi:energy-coupling factor transporter ATP-binding protein EcfA2